MSPSKIDDLKRDLNQLTGPRGQKHAAPAGDRGRDAVHPGRIRAAISRRSLEQR